MGVVARPSHRVDVPKLSYNYRADVSRPSHRADVSRLSYNYRVDVSRLIRLIKMSELQVPVLQWPSFCYPTPALFDDEAMMRGRKRKMEEDSVLGSPTGSCTSEEEQKVPETQDLSPRSSLGSPDRDSQAASSEFTFSNMMKRMAAKYQKEEDPKPTPPVGFFPLLPQFLPQQPSLASSHILAAIARVHQSSTSPAPLPPTKRQRMEQPGPLDLSPRTQERCHSPDQEILDVVSVQPTPHPASRDCVPLEDWSIQEVANFISQIDTCQEYAQALKDQKVDGASLAVLNETHLTTILGIQLGPATRIVSRVRRILNSQLQ